jgi:hypothetical protein
MFESVLLGYVIVNSQFFTGVKLPENGLVSGMNENVLY